MIVEHSVAGALGHKRQQRSLWSHSPLVSVHYYASEQVLSPVAARAIFCEFLGPIGNM
jgi:hypothetical protein